MWATNNVKDLDLDLDFELDLDSGSESSSVISTSDESQPQVPVNTPTLLTPAARDRPPSFRNGHTSDSSENPSITADSLQHTPPSSEDESIRGVPLPEGTESTPYGSHQNNDLSGDEESAGSSPARNFDDDSADEDYDFDFEDDFVDDCLTDPEPEAEQAETLEAHMSKLYSRIAEQDGHYSNIVRGNRGPSQTDAQPTMQEEVSTVRDEATTTPRAPDSPRPEDPRYFTISVVSPFAEPLEFDIGHNVSMIGLKVQFLHAVDIDKDQVNNLNFNFGTRVLDHQCTPDDVGLKHMDTIFVETRPES